MVKKKAATASTKRYTYSSFKDRIDKINITKPLLRTTRTDFEVEVSNFYESYEHWKEINITQNFTEFVSSNEQYFQTLPQLIYHKDRIFNELIAYLLKEDNIELTYEPFLDLLAQFVHDLGEDFYVPYYTKTVGVLSQLAVAKFDNSNILEWIFNCLGFIFKYLASELSKNLTETFELLLPLFQYTRTKTYLSRFSSEALSFLIKKVHAKNINAFVQHNIEQLEQNEELAEPLITMYSEAMTNVNGAFHSKAKPLLNGLLQISSASPRSNAMVCDVVLNLLSYCTAETSNMVYDTVLEHIGSYIQKEHTDKATIQLLIALSFAQSGKKVPSWNALLETIHICIKNAHSHDIRLNHSVVQLLAVTLRNCELKDLAKFHVTIFQHMIQMNDGQHFLPFVQVAGSLTRERMTTFGHKYIQEFFNTKWESNTKEIALYLSQNSTKLPFTIPHNLHKSVQDDLKAFTSLKDVSDLKELHWRLQIVNNSEEAKPSDTLVDILKNLMDNLSCAYAEDIAGLVVQCLAGLKSESKEMIIWVLLTANFERLRSSNSFLKGMLSFIELSTSIEMFSHDAEKFLFQVSANVSSAAHEIRYLSLSILRAFFAKTSNDIPSVVSQCHIIEDIPLTLQTARDIQIRTRSLAHEFARDSQDALAMDLLPRYLFGLLSMKFKPAWDAAFEAMDVIRGKSANELWELACYFINKDYSAEAEELDYLPIIGLGTEDQAIDNSDWISKDTRLNDNTSLTYGKLESFTNLNTALISSFQAQRSDSRYNNLVRSHVLTALNKMPEIAEKHTEQLVPLLLNDDIPEDEGAEIISSASWTAKDRDLLLNVFEKFTKPKQMYKTQEVYDFMLVLLGNRQPHIQKSALTVIFKYKNPHVMKYKDNLFNLLDETLFRDELSKFVAFDKDVNIIEDEDRNDVMELALRILFGRVQVAKTSGMNRGKKFAVVSVLPTLQEEHIVQFLSLISERIPFNAYFETKSIDGIVITEKMMRRSFAFTNLLSDIIGTLGVAFNQALKVIVEPLVFSLACAQKAIDTESSFLLEKVARQVRTVGMKCLTELFNNFKSDYKWSDIIEIIYDHLIVPRLANFAQENLQQPSSLLRLLVSWGTTPYFHTFLYLDNHRVAKEILSLLPNEKTKDTVLSLVFDFSLAIVNTTSVDDEFIDIVSEVVEANLRSLSNIFDRVENKDVNSKAIKLLLSLSQNGYIEDYDTKITLIHSLSNAFQKPHATVMMSDKVNILKSLSSLVEDFTCSLNDVVPLYDACSRALKTYNDRRIRQNLCEIFKNLSARFTDIEDVGDYLDGLNSYSSKRVGEPDYERRLSTFRKINDECYLAINDMSWLPLIFTALYYMSDVNELAIRTSATYTLCKFIDCFSAKSSATEAEPFIKQLKNIILPAVRLGIRDEEEVVQSAFVSVLAHIVTHVKYFEDLNDMRVLLFEEDEEANFFANVNHVQIHRRQRTIRRLRAFGDKLSDSSISHYIIPMVEQYAFSQEEKLLNVSSETITTVGELSKFMSWNQHRALLRRYVSYMSSPKRPLKNSVHLVVAVLRNFSEVIKSQDESYLIARSDKLSAENVSSYIIDELFPPVTKVLAIRDDDTVAARVPLSEALMSLVICLDSEKIAVQLPTILGPMCQIMKSRSEATRDVIRKNLGNVAKILGPNYFKFIIQELKTALKRGSQIHVLSFTIHSLLVFMTNELKHGDLDECMELLVDIVMEDAFGAAGQEKEAEGYSNKMKEIKHNKSFDTAEILASKVSLGSFYHLIAPVKLLVTERIALKTQNKLDELLRRYSLGINHNEQGSTHDILVLCYQLHRESKELLNANGASTKTKKSSEDHFLVKLNARSQKTQNEHSLYLHTLQKFSLDLLRIAISRNESLATTANLEGFVPLLEESLYTEDESVIISSMRVLNQVVRLPFSEAIDNVFKTCARRALSIIKDSPSTTSELSQISLRFLSTVIRHKSDIKLKDTALSYILVRLQPDLQEPHKQGLAFGFLRALVSSHIMLAEIYDTMDKVAEIMVTNQAKEIRDMSRSVYFQFLMEYDQSRGRLEKQFKFLVNNLQYPAEKGRQSVMELLHLILNKAGAELLSKLSTSFFVSLTLVMISDSSNKCREMATALINLIFKKVAVGPRKDIEKYITSWTSQTSNAMLLRCGLQSFKLYLSENELTTNKDLSNNVLERIKEILNLAKKSDEGDEVDWESIYCALTVLATIFQKSGEKAFSEDYEMLWVDVIDSLTYPHSWVRLASTKLIASYIAKVEALNISDAVVQNIAYKLLRQLSAPGLSEQLGTHIVKNMAQISMYWQKKHTKYISSSETAEVMSANEWAINRASIIIRQETGEDLNMNKKFAIQYTALIIQIVPVDELLNVAESIILPLYNLSEGGSEASDDIKNLTAETLSMLESKIGVTEYAQAYSNVRRRVVERRQDRRAKRSQLAVFAPDVAAKRKIKKHERFREKRKANKDENGYYKPKRKKLDRMLN